MTAEPAPGLEFFTAPTEPNQRRYEALRAYFVEQTTLAEAGARSGYTRASMASLLRDFRAGKVQMFAAPAKPGPKSAPAKDRARARVVELRREGLSVTRLRGPVPPARSRSRPRVTTARSSERVTSAGPNIRVVSGPSTPHRPALPGPHGHPVAHRG